VNVEKQADAGLNLRVPIKAGPRDIGVAFLEKSSALIETERQPWMRRHAADYADQRTQPVLWTVTISGPFESAGAGDTPSRSRILTCRPGARVSEAACARTILTALARRAYRRTPTDQDVRDLLRFYQDARTKSGFEEGIEAALRALLVSPQFLFRIETDPANAPAGTAYRLSDVELATRLSFFLWSSIPDDQLLDVAVRGELSNPAVLDAQVRRMLTDPKSEELVRNFAGQWLYLRNLSQIVPDPRLYPDFDELLRQAFRRETELFFGSILGEQRSVLELLTADFTFLNERLARHYGVPNVYGENFRRVHVADENRRGLLGHGSVLTVTSYATRTSPVVRGKWILENVLGSPPPEPPPNVPPLPDSNKGDSGKVLTMRERMAKHRANPVLRNLSLDDRPGWLRARVLRRGRQVPSAGRGIQPDRRRRHACRWHEVQRRGRSSGRPCSSRPDRFVDDGLGEAAHLRRRPRRHAGRHARVRKIVRDASADNYKLSSLISAS
jgi:hypothetical protein